MCKSQLHDFVRKLPKCEHHVHLEGTLMPATLFELAKRNGVALPSNDPAYRSVDALLERYQKFSSLDDFLGYYGRGMDVLQQKHDFEDLTYDYLSQAHDDGVVHAEISFDPQAHVERLPFDAVVEGIGAGRRRAEQEFGMSTLLIMCFQRHLGQPAALTFLQKPEVQEKFQSGTIVGIGLDSSEIGYPPELFEDVFKSAHKYGLKLTAHAGEEGPAENISKSLDVLGCQRIDHGLRAGRDATLMARLAETQTLLTFCPLSNVSLKCLSDVGQAPIRVFLDNGVHFSINSDDPAYLGEWHFAKDVVTVSRTCLQIPVIWTSCVLNSMTDVIRPYDSSSIVNQSEERKLVCPTTCLYHSNDLWRASNSSVMPYPMIRLC